MIYRSIILSLLIVICSTAFGQGRIIGYVKDWKSGISISNVKVYSTGAKSTFTNSQGYFELEFQYKGAGDFVRSVQFQLTGHKVINEPICKNIVLASDPSLSELEIYIAKEEEYSQQYQIYFNGFVSFIGTNIQEERKLLTGEIDRLSQHLVKLEQEIGLSQSNKLLVSERDSLLIALELFQEESRQLHTDLTNANEKAEYYANQFTSIISYKSSELAKTALLLIEEGRFDEAINLLNRNSLAIEAENALTRREQLKSLLADANQQVQQSIDNYLLRSKLLESRLDFDSAELCYLEALRIDSTNNRVLNDYCRLLERRGDISTSIEYYQQLLDVEFDNRKRLHLYFKLTQLYNRAYDFFRSSEMADYGLKIYYQYFEGLHSDNEITTIVARLYVYKALANGNKKRRRLWFVKAAISVIEERFDTTDKDLIGTYGDILVDYGIILCNNRQDTSGVIYIRKGINYLENVFNSGNKNFVFELGKSYVDLAIYLNYQKKFVTRHSKDYYEKSLYFFGKIGVDNKDYCGACLAKVQLILGEVELLYGHYYRAEMLYNSAQKIMEKLRLVNFSEFGDQLILSYLHQAELYSTIGDFSQSTKKYDQAFYMADDLRIYVPEEYIQWNLLDAIVSELWVSYQVYYPTIGGFYPNPEPVGYEFAYGPYYNYNLRLNNRLDSYMPFWLETRECEAITSLRAYNFKGSIQSLKKLLKEKEFFDKPFIFYQIALAYSKWGKQKRAKQFFKKCLISSESAIDKLSKSEDNIPKFMKLKILELSLIAKIQLRQTLGVKKELDILISQYQDSLIYGVEVSLKKQADLMAYKGNIALIEKDTSLARLYFNNSIELLLQRKEQGYLLLSSVDMINRFQEIGNWYMNEGLLFDSENYLIKADLHLKSLMDSLDYIPRDLKRSLTFDKARLYKRLYEATRNNDYQQKFLTAYGIIEFELDPQSFPIDLKDAESLLYEDF